MAFVSPIDVVLDDQNIVQPDVIYLAEDRLPAIEDQIQGPPSLVVEVLSPSTANRDRQEKLDLYARFGVPEYWIVDPEMRSIDFLVNDDGRFVIVTPVRDVYRSAVTPEVEIKLVDFWGQVERRMPRSRG
jgi:Uma2 family endonuclease